MHSESQVFRGPLCTTTDPVSMLKAEAVVRGSSSPKAAIPNLPHFSLVEVNDLCTG